MVALAFVTCLSTPLVCACQRTFTGHCAATFYIPALIVRAHRDGLLVCCHSSCHLQVHQGVELRVKAAIAWAEQLEAQQELAAAQHAQHTQQLQQQQADLEAALQEARQRAADLQAQLEAAHAAGVSQQHRWQEDRNQS